MPVLALDPSAVMFLAPAVLILGGLAVLVRFGWWDRRWWREFDRRAVRTDATVADARVLTHGSGASLAFSYQPIVTFTLPDGTEQRARTRWASPVQPTKGESLAIRYDPEAPQDIIHADGPGGEPPGRGSVLFIGGGAIVLGGVVLSVVRAII